jgi:hypothetical protein
MLIEIYFASAVRSSLSQKSRVVNVNNKVATRRRWKRAAAGGEGWSLEGGLVPPI